jgi:uncharacterized protein YecE (DUF72 family)
MMAASRPYKVAIEERRISSRSPVRVGCAGWGIPKHATTSFGSVGSHLDRYSQVFNSCEINSSFNRPHKKETWERWASSVPAEFRFSVKAPRTITHEAKLNCSSEVLSAFLEQIKFLGDKLGPVLIQLPPSLEFDRVRAGVFLTLLRKEYAGDVVWEPRHESWFSKRVDDLLKEFHVARVAADPACAPTPRQPAGRTILAYFRLHGSPRRYYSAYSEDFLDDLSAQVTSLARRAQVWCVFDNTASGAATQNALALMASLRQQEDAVIPSATPLKLLR